jgi:hypothetical protein
MHVGYGGAKRSKRTKNLSKTPARLRCRVTDVAQRLLDGTRTPAQAFGIAANQVTACQVFIATGATVDYVTVADAKRNLSFWQGVAGYINNKYSKGRKP